MRFSCKFQIEDQLHYSRRFWIIFTFLSPHFPHIKLSMCLNSTLRLFILRDKWRAFYFSQALSILFNGPPKPEARRSGRSKDECEELIPTTGALRDLHFKSRSPWLPAQHWVIPLICITKMTRVDNNLPWMFLLLYPGTKLSRLRLVLKR